MELLLYEFTLVHRPADMVTECNMLSRYNAETERWQRAELETTATAKTPVTVHLAHPNFHVLFNEEQTGNEMVVQTFSSLPKIQYVGALAGAS